MARTMTVTELARKASITKKYAFNLVQAGRLGATKDGDGVWRIPEEAVEAFIRLRRARQKANEILTTVVAAL